jgi:phage regulator Rha-like protein
MCIDTKALPSKIDLLKGGLVDFTSNHKSVATNSLKIAESLDVQHSDVTRVIKRLLKNGAISQRTIAVSDYLSERGKAYKYYELNEVEALQVVMSLTGKKAEQLHKVIAQAFVAMKSELNDWRTGRHLASDSTKLANDNIFWLSTALTETMPASKKGSLLFVHIQQAINKAATGSAKVEDRNKLLTCQLHRIEQLEQAVHVQIERLKADDIKPEQIRIDVLAKIRTAYDKPIISNLIGGLSDAA